MLTVFVMQPSLGTTYAVQHFIFQWWDWRDFVKIRAPTTPPLNPSSSLLQWPSRNPLWCKSYPGQALLPPLSFFQLVEHTPALGTWHLLSAFLGILLLNTHINCFLTAPKAPFRSHLNRGACLGSIFLLTLLPDICIRLCLLMEKETATHSSTLAWRIPWMEEPGGLQSMWLVRVRHDWVTSLSLFTLMHWRRKWQPTPVFLPGESHPRDGGAWWADVYGVA